MITLMIVDDHPMTRQLLSRRLMAEPDMRVLGEAEDGMQALALVPALRPNIVVMDIHMPRMDGLAATAALHTIAPHSAVILFSSDDDRSTRSRAQAVGAQALIAKNGTLDALLAEIRRVAVPVAPATA